MKQADLFDAEAARDAGIARVENNNKEWMEEAHRRYIAWSLRCRGQRIIGEEIRIGIEKLLPPPKHVNAWGALIRSLMMKGWLIPTAEFKKPKSKKSHARVQRVYVVA